ncbi:MULTISPECIES: NUDIX hydrolase [Ruminococcus]|uniref:Hydrolase, NUDIX family n=1 Tax=Ruminococcus albus 8 TaxID=246199 RepID=E9S7V5_RUMAL|nr:MULTISPECIES: NUDIX hydrolase [Ruminococcus]EGC04543.1 hydrolase, NUDIX family [Ruminococcus albus 8]MBE6873703.1 NUDIX hydrolase [Ruminococcus albus]MBO5557916.1 NUDIX hydrolase [Ruminococcus sp.]MCC3351377.1 NUDIX hydrolase [Ruminococcus albus 8]
MYQKEKALTSEQIFDGVVVKLYRDEIELENGERAVREYIRHPGGVCVAAVDDDENIYMVEQFRYPFGKALTEVPAGKLEFGEDPEQCGRRELKEEVGAVADSFEYLGCIYPTVAYDTEIIHMFLARGLHFGEQHLDDGEFLDVKKIPLKEVYRMVMANELNDAKTQMAVLKTYLKLHGEV